MKLALPSWQEDSNKGVLEEHNQTLQPEKTPSLSSTENEDSGRKEPFRELFWEDGECDTDASYICTVPGASQTSLGIVLAQVAKAKYHKLVS